MEALGKRTLALISLYLIASLEIAQLSLVTRVIGQDQESFEDFLKRLQGYLEDAMPPESAPINESEYIVPEGFASSDAEQIWISLGPYVSLGFSEEEIRAELSKGGPLVRSFNLIDGTRVWLNFSRLEVQRLSDGSVNVRIPVASNTSLKYVYCNSTDLKKVYEVWNETSSRYYRVRSLTSYNITYIDLVTGEEFSVVSRLTLRAYPSLLSFVSPTEIQNLNWGVVASCQNSSSPVIAVPGHYEEVKTLVPSQRVQFKVLFPEYDPVFFTGWIVDATISSSSLAVGEVLKIYFVAVPEAIDPEQEPLNATIHVVAPDSFQIIGQDSMHLDNSHLSGSFSLKALNPGTYETALIIDGNADFRTVPAGKEQDFTVEVVAPISPSIGVRITKVDTSIVKHANLTIELKNNGASTSKNVEVEITGDVERIRRSLGDIEAGKGRIETFLVKLRSQTANIVVKVRYFDEANNPYLSQTETIIVSANYVVPEHFENYTGIIPEHTETEMVFVPGFEGYTHVRFYTASTTVTANPNVFSATKLNFPGFVLDVPKILSPQESSSGGSVVDILVSLIPVSLPGLEMEVTKDPALSGIGESGVRFMVKAIEPVWLDYDSTREFLPEKEAASLMGINVRQLRNGQIPNGYEAELARVEWERSGSIVLNSTEFEGYVARIEEFKRVNELTDDDLKCNKREYVEANRNFTEVSQKGFAVFIYHPLSVKGNGPLRSVQVKNYAALDLGYEVRESSIAPTETAFAKESTAEVNVFGMDTASLLLSSMASERKWARISLFYGVGIIAQLEFELVPEISQFWTGFWAGIGQRLPGIVLSSGILILLSVPTGGSALVTKLHSVAEVIATGLFFLCVGSNAMEIIQASDAVMRMDAVAGELDNAFVRFREAGYNDFSSRAANLANRIRNDSKYIIANTALDLVADVSIRDLVISIGQQNVSDYEKGQAIGRTVGTMLSFAAYTAIYYNLISNAPKLASISGKAKAFLKGVWNWMTPAVFDLAFMGGAYAAKSLAGSMLMSESSQPWKDNFQKTDLSSEAELKLIVESDELFADAFDVSKKLGENEGFFAKLVNAFGKSRRQSGDGEGFESKSLDGIEDLGSKEKGLTENLIEYLDESDDRNVRNALELIADESIRADLINAWESNKQWNDFEELLKGLVIGPDLGQERRERLYDLFHEFVQTEEPEGISSFSRTLGWMADVRNAFEPTDLKRTRIIDKTLDLAEALHSKTLDPELDSESTTEWMKETSEILVNLLQTDGREGAYIAFIRFWDHLFVDVELDSEGFDAQLLEDCLKKWETASPIENAFVSRQRLSGDDYEANTPDYVGYLMVDQYTFIPVEAVRPRPEKEGCLIDIPKSVARYLIEDAEYLTRYDGFDIFVREKPEGSSIVVPVIVDKEGDITITRWFKKVFKDDPSSAKYFDENGFILWEELDRDHMALGFTVSNGDKECSRLIILKPRGSQKLIVTSVDDIAKDADLVLLHDFRMEQVELLSLEEAAVIFRNDFDIKDEEVIAELAKRLYQVMAMSKEEGLSLTDNDLKGKFSEWEYFQVVYKELVGYQTVLSYTDEAGNSRTVKIDLETKSEYIESKNWGKGSLYIETWVSQMLDELEGYKGIHDATQKDVVLAFYRELGEDEIDYLKGKLTGRFRSLDWLTICNGFDDFVKYMAKE